ncbi:amidohydrolase [Antribacter gilvus]|uniref:amidohydrolase n=1 Tax=Antribacter gilvus TaxID=2304675 RepID=UPI000F792376|nr:amidohydrolase [Antribacter gilvus]
MNGLILVGARVLGTDGLVDLYVQGDRLTAVVPAGEAAPEAPGPGAPERVQLDGRLVVPGLWDAHTHLTQWALVRRRLDVSGATSAAHAVRLVAACLADPAMAPAPGQPLVGFGFRWAVWPDEPTAALLDAVAGGTPVVLLSGDLHTAWAGTAGLRFLGIEHPTGLLREDEWIPASPRIVQAPDDVTDALVADAARAAAQRGVVGVTDFEVADNLAVWRRRAGLGWDALRVRAGVWPEHLDAVLAEGLRTGGTFTASPLLTQGPLKVISDGSLNTRTAYCFEPYAGATGPDAHGLLNVPTDDLVPLMARATAGGLDCAIHAIGDRANALALDAFAASGARGSVEHAQLLRWSDVERFARLGVTASVQPEHAMDDRDVAEQLWPGRADRTFPLASLARAGVRVVLGSDAPVAPLDPWIALASAVTRSRDGREPWHPEQALTLPQGLAASTDGRGTAPVAGGPADLAVLDVPSLDEPAVASDALRTLPVAATLLAGQWSHRRL